MCTLRVSFLTIVIWVLSTKYLTLVKIPVMRLQSFPCMRIHYSSSSPIQESSSSLATVYQNYLKHIRWESYASRSYVPVDNSGCPEHSVVSGVARCMELVRRGCGNSKHGAPNLLRGANSKTVEDRIAHGRIVSLGTFQASTSSLWRGYDLVDNLRVSYSLHWLREVSLKV